MSETLTLTEAALQARASREQMTRWLLTGRILGLKAGTRWVVDRQSLEDFLASRAAAANRETRRGH